jgi:hypothetical protein
VRSREDLHHLDLPMTPLRVPGLDTHIALVVLFPYPTDAIGYFPRQPCLALLPSLFHQSQPQVLSRPTTPRLRPSRMVSDRMRL